MRRHTRESPCLICDGHESMPQGRGARCWGFLSSDGLYEHCTREEFAGPLATHAGSGAFAHRLDGECRCGQFHGLDHVLPPRMDSRHTAPRIETLGPLTDSQIAFLLESGRLTKPATAKTARPQ